MIEITSTQIDEFTTPAPVTLSNECQEVCPEASFLLQDACPVNCVPLAEQPVKCHANSEMVKLRPPRGLRHCFIVGLNKDKKTTCNGVCETCKNEIDIYRKRLDNPNINRTVIS